MLPATLVFLGFASPLGSVHDAVVSCPVLILQARSWGLGSGGAVYRESRFSVVTCKMGVKENCCCGGCYTDIILWGRVCYTDMNCACERKLVPFRSNTWNMNKTF